MISKQSKIPVFSQDKFLTMSKNKIRINYNGSEVLQQ